MLLTDNNFLQQHCARQLSGHSYSMYKMQQHLLSYPMCIHLQYATDFVSLSRTDYSVSFVCTWLSCGASQNLLGITLAEMDKFARSLNCEEHDQMQQLVDIYTLLCTVYSLSKFPRPVLNMGEILQKSLDRKFFHIAGPRFSDPLRLPAGFMQHSGFVDVSIPPFQKQIIAMKCNIFKNFSEWNNQYHILLSIFCARSVIF